MTARIYWITIQLGSIG